MIRSSIIACATIVAAIVCASFVGHYLQHVFASLIAALAV